jgi:YegS/Rv2252/BmrU family lipid kinase
MHYIVNPASQNGATGKKWPRLEAVLPKAAHVHLTKAPGEAIELAEQAALAGADVVVAVGGDGTIGEVATGLMRSARKPALGLVPCGTGGDFRKTLGYPSAPAAVASVLARGQTRVIDVGHVRFLGHNGREQERYFVNICSFGISGVVDRAVNRSSKMFGGALSFLLGTLRGYAQFTGAELELALDDGPFEKHDSFLVAACNGRMFGGGMRLAPTADLSDGQLDIVVWDHMTQLGKLGSWRIYSGDHLALPNVQYRSAKRLQARAAGEVLIDCDGEPLGRLPLTIDIVPQALRVVC